MSTAELGYEAQVPPVVEIPPQPGDEAAGPAMTDLFRELGHVRHGLDLLMRRAAGEAFYRQQTVVSPGNTDGSGNAILPVFVVPAGCTGRMVWLSVDEAGATPNAPDTGASLWHAIYGAPGAPAGGQGGTPISGVVAVGALKDFRTNGATAGKSRIPDVYTYSDWRAAPTLVGPATFYFVIQAANVNRQVAVNATIYIEQPEP